MGRVQIATFFPAEKEKKPISNKKNHQFDIARNAPNRNKNHKSQYNQRRSRTNVFRACQRRAGLYTKLRIDYRRKAATSA